MEITPARDTSDTEPSLRPTANGQSTSLLAFTLATRQQFIHIILADIVHAQLKALAEFKLVLERFNGRFTDNLCQPVPPGFSSSEKILKIHNNIGV